MGRLKTELLVGLLVALLTAVAYLTMPTKFQALDNQLRDYMFLIRGPVKPSGNVIIIDIDEKSLQKLGQWPWKRKDFAQVLRNLTQAGAAIIGLDIVFAELDNSNPSKVLKELGMSSEGVEDYDQILADTVAQTPTILGYVFQMEDDGIQADRLPSVPAIFIERNKQDREFLLHAHRATLNIPMLQEAAYSSGFFNTLPDGDSGIIRSVPLVMKHQGVVYPSLSMEMIRIMSEASKVFVNYGEDIGVETIQSGDIEVPTDQFGRLLVNYRGPAFTFKYLSAYDIYQGNFDPKQVAGKFVLVGTSAAGLLDLRATPFANVYPGVEIHANVIDNILTQDYICKPSWTIAVDMFLIFGMGIVLAVILGQLSAIMTVIVLVIAMMMGLGFNYYMLFEKGIALNILFDVVILSILVYIISMVLNYFLETKQKNLIKGKFANKVSPEVMEDILRHSDTEDWDGIEKEVTVFFSDVRGFTNISEAMGNAKTLIQLMNDIMEPMTEIITDEHGTVDKFIGDAIMAYWNAPHDVKNHADKAVQASLRQLFELQGLNDKVRQDPRYKKVVAMADANHIPVIDIGIGLNTGKAIVGEMGSKGRSDYTAIGDAVNLASRLESLCKYYNSRLNISNFTKAKLKGEYIYRFLDLVTVKGKKKPVEIWQIHDYVKGPKRTLFGFDKAELIKELDYYHQAIDFYKAEAFDKALPIFKEINSWKHKSNLKIYDIYIERCEYYIKHPPEDFNGVFVHTTKG